MRVIRARQTCASTATTATATTAATTTIITALLRYIALPNMDWCVARRQSDRLDQMNEGTNERTNNQQANEEKPKSVRQRENSFQILTLRQ